MSTDFVSLCPFRPGSASRKLFLAVARASKPMSTAEIARAAHLPSQQVSMLCSEYLSIYHRSPLTKKGVRLKKTDEGYVLEGCKAQPNCRRPSRGEEKTAKTPKKKTKKGVKARTPFDSVPVDQVLPVDTLTVPETDTLGEASE